MVRKGLMPVDLLSIKGRVILAVHSLEISIGEAKRRRWQAIRDGIQPEYVPLRVNTVNPWTGQPAYAYFKEYSVSHNLVVDEGDDLIADLLQNTTERTKLDSSNGYMAVGTAGTSPTKGATNWVQTPTGSAEVMDAGYPQTKGAWAAANANVIVYKATFEAGDLNDTGIDEAVLANGTSEGASDTMAYAQMTSVDVTTVDTLAITWEITLLGA